jgi:hypothetical protein
MSRTASLISLNLAGAANQAARSEPQRCSTPASVSNVPKVAEQPPGGERRRKAVVSAIMLETTPTFRIGVGNIYARAGVFEWRVKITRFFLVSSSAREQQFWRESRTDRLSSVW